MDGGLPSQGHPADASRERAEALRRELADWEHRLFVLGHPPGSWRAFVALRAELAGLEAEGIPQTLDSPTRRLGASPRPTFTSAPHGSFWTEPPAVHSVAELKLHHGRASALEGPEATFVASATLQGVEVALTYIDGVLERAVLRGDGEKGDDVTDNLRTVGSVPLRLRPPGSLTESRVTKLTRQALGPSTLSPVPPFPASLVVRAVVAMRNADLTSLDRRRVDAGDPPYILPRGAVLGSLRRLDPRVTASRRLELFATGCETAPSGVESAWQLLGALKSWGFAVSPVTWRVKGFQEILDFIAALQQLAPTFEYPLEGGVLAANRLGPSPREELPPVVRLAFPNPGRPAVVTKVYHAVGRGGAVLPVALLGRPQGSDLPIPERAPVPAESGDAFTALEPGSLVRVRPGSVAPILIPEVQATADRALDRCPACGSTLEAPSDEPFRACASATCAGRARARLLHLVGPRGLRLGGLGVKACDRLLAEVGPLDLPELLLLDPAKVDRVAPGQGAPFEEEVKRLTALPLWRALYLAAIPHMSEHVARAVAHHVGDLGRLEALGPDACFSIADVPPESAQALGRWLRADGERYFVRLRETEVRILGGPEVFAAPFLARRVVVAGELEIGAVHAADEIERRGGLIQTRVDRTTDLLVAGKNAAKAFDAAAVYGIPTVNEAALLEVFGATSAAVTR